MAPPHGLLGGNLKSPIPPSNLMKKALLAVLGALGVEADPKASEPALVRKLSDETGMSPTHIEEMLSRKGINTELLSGVTVREAREGDVPNLTKHVLYNFMRKKPIYHVPKLFTMSLETTFKNLIQKKQFRYKATPGSLVIEEKKIGLGLLGHLNYYGQTIDSICTHQMFQGSPEKETRNMLGKLLVLKAMQIIKKDHGSIMVGTLTHYGVKLFDSMGFEEMTREEKEGHPNPKFPHGKARKYEFWK